MSDRTVAIGIDIGGSGAKGGLVSPAGRILGRSSAPTSDSYNRSIVLDRYGEMIRDLLRQADAAPIFCPEKVLIGGGVAACGDLFFDAVRQGVRQVAAPFYIQNLTVESARLSNRAGFMGAASLILKNPD